MSVPEKIQAWQMTKAGDPKAGTPGVLERVELDVPELAEGWRWRAAACATPTSPTSTRAFPR